VKYVSVAEAKAKLSEILDGVIAGDEVIITRRGKEIARLGGIGAVSDANTPRDPLTWEILKARIEARPLSTGNAVVEMRELDRY
jgi:prevent-host-death family protein